MIDTLHGFPYWLLEFEKDGLQTDPGTIDRSVNEVASQHISDLYIFSHGWNNDRAKAPSLYDGFFGEVRKIVDNPRLPKKNQAARMEWPASSGLPYSGLTMKKARRWAAAHHALPQGPCRRDCLSRGELREW